MTDDLKTRLRWAADNSDGCGKWNCDPADLDAAADRIEELEAKINFLVQPDSPAPNPSYRGWVIADESNGSGTFWYAYTYDWKSGEWDSPHFMMVSGDFDDVTAEIDRRTGEKQWKNTHPKTASKS